MVIVPDNRYFMLSENLSFTIIDTCLSLNTVYFSVKENKDLHRNLGNLRFQLDLN